MNPLFWVAAALLLAVVAALTGFAPKGGKPVARTKLMKTARWFLFALVIVCVGIGLFATVRR
jgi:hypothetical protein